MALPEIMIGAPIDARGAIASAPVDSTLPIDAASELDPGFETVGLIGPEGFESDPQRTTAEIPVWGGMVAREVTTDFKELFRFTIMESANAENLKRLYGSDNVVVGEGGGISVKKNAAMPDPEAWALTMKDGDGRRRVVIPKGQLKLNGAVVYVHSDAIKYPVEVTGLVDDEGNTSYEYIADTGDVEGP